MEENKATAAYIHIPFCSHICYYCDFAKVLLDGQPVDEYIDALIKEFNSYNIHCLNTLYIGGGTPTVLSTDQMEKLLFALTARIDLTQLSEFTVEANPSDLTNEMITMLSKSPVNRISLGVQTFDDQLLKKIGRTHTKADVYSSIEKLKNIGFENITIDLIYGLPGQTMSMVQQDISKFLTLNLPHVALYSLILEDHTVFMNRERRGLLNLPNDDLSADMYEYIVDNLLTHGYTHYEISNFSKNGYESKHNLTYWNNSEYYGIGAGASGYLDGIRYKNHGPVAHYLKNTNKRVSEEVLTTKSKIEEEMFLGLRKKEGVSRSKFQEVFSINIEDIYGSEIKKLSDIGLLVIDSDRVYMTERGFELGNEVFQAFLLNNADKLFPHENY